MHATLKIITGPAEGRSIALEMGTLVKIGRAERADVSVPVDDRMSGVHFSILLQEDGACRIQDLGSKNGLYRNDLTVAETTIGPEDEVRAGRSTFVLHVQKPSSDAASPASDEAAAPATERPMDENQTELEANFTVPPAYIAEELPSSLFVFRSRDKEPGPVGTALLLSRMEPMFLICDFANLGDELPKNLDNPDFLFHWLPKEAAREVSPVLIGPKDKVNRFELIKKGWDKDAVVCLFSDQKKPVLLEHLRAAVRGRKCPDGPLVEGKMVGCCWPKLFDPILTEGRPEYVDFLMTGIAAVLVEGEEPESWQVYSGSGFRDALDELGFSEAPPEAESPSTDSNTTPLPPESSN